MLDGDERLMMQIIDAEETYMTEWLEAHRGIMEAQIKEIDSLRASSKSLLRETNELRFLQVGYLILSQCVVVITKSTNAGKMFSVIANVQYSAVQ